MPRKKSPKDHLSKARAKGSEECKKEIDGSASLGRVDPRTLKSYQRMVDMWHQFVSEKIERIDAEGLSDNPPSPYDLKSLKDFVTDIALGIDGADDNPNPGEGTVLLYWKQFTAGWRRDHDAIPGNITLPTERKILLENGADVYAKDKACQGPADLKEERKYDDATELLKSAMQHDQEEADADHSFNLLSGWPQLMTPVHSHPHTGDSGPE